MKPRLVVVRPMPAAVTERARTEFDPVIAEEPDWPAEAVLQATAAHRAEALLITSFFPFRADLIRRLPETVRVAATCSVGFDHVDVEAARARGLIVTNTPEVLTDCTADMAFMLILAGSRRAHEYDSIVRSGGWTRSFGLNEMLGRRVSGKTLGIVGLGRIGRAVAQRARGFDMRVLYHDAVRLPPDLEAGAEYFADLRAMLPHCQILSLHAPGGSETDRMLNAETFALLPKGAVFVNAARGGLVDDDALVNALKSGHLFAAGLDVFRNEPAFDKRLAELPNTFLTPHMASATVETRNAMGFRALDNIAAVLAGKPPIDPLWK
jgi:lactate dehydrogenase-like 2-hydroxyacid dehydrogenase